MHWRALKSIIAGLSVAFLGGVLSPCARAEAKTNEVAEEIHFASSLVSAGFADYAEKVVAQLLAKHPEAKAQSAAIKIRVLTSRGKFDEAEAFIKSQPPDSPETTAMQLSLGDAYYAWGKMAKARDVYNAFFGRFPKGPPADLARLYGESAYKFAQMQIFSGDTAGAVQAYRLVLLSKPEADVARGVKTEMAELLLRLAEKAGGDERKKIAAETRKLCEDVQWGGLDVAFGKTVVILAHLELLEGRKDAARAAIDNNMSMLKKIDEALKESKEQLKFSPMAECKYTLGLMNEEDLRAMVEQGTKDREKEILDLAKQTLSSYYTVLINYPTSTCASDAGRRGDALVSFLESKGFRIKVPRGNLAAVADAQFREARTLFQQQDFKAAAERYRDALNVFPDYPGCVPSIGLLAQCYIQQRDFLYAQAVAGYLVDRYSRAETNLFDEAGNALLDIAAAYDEVGEKGQAAATSQQFYSRFPTHRRAASAIFREGEVQLRAENYAGALPFYGEIIAKFSKERIYVEALNRSAYCYTMLGDHTNAAEVLRKYIAELSVGPDQLLARVRLADAYRLSEQLIPAINEYATVAVAVLQEPAKYGATAEDLTKNNRSLERALFWKSLCYLRLKEPADQLSAYQAKAVVGFTDLLTKFPKSEMAPTVLNALGTAYFLQNKPDEAEKVYARLAREYPQSEQSSNVVFAQGRSLMEIGRMEDAIKVFGRMFDNPAAFKPIQFLQVGGVMLEAGQHEMALKAYEKSASPTAERSVWEQGMMGQAKVLMATGKFADAVKPIETLLAKYTTSWYRVEGSFMLSRSYAETAAKMPAGDERVRTFNKAIRALNTVRQISREPDSRAHADYETATVQLLMGDKQAAQASYQRIILLADANNPKIVVWIDKAMENGCPLLLELKRYADVIDVCETYLRSLPQGRMVTMARQWRDAAKLKAASAGATGGK